MAINNNPAQPAYLISGLPTGMNSNSLVATDASANLTSIALGTGVSTALTGAVNQIGGLITFAAFAPLSGKALTLNNSLTLAGTDSTTMTFPSTNATLARTDAGQTFTGSQTFNGDAFNFTSATAFSPLVTIWNQTNSANAAYCILQKSRGASGAGAAVQVNDILGDFLFRGADTGGTIRNSSYLEALVTAVGAASVDSAFRMIALGATSYVSLMTNGTNQRLYVDAVGNVVMGTAALATTATDGFFYAPSCAGVPTGVPTSYTGRSPIIVDTTSGAGAGRLWIRVGATWRFVALT
jgi:hypothetical protein